MSTTSHNLAAPGTPGRVCGTTGLHVCFDAQRFIKLNAVSGIVFLLLGGIAALLLALTRWQTVHLLPVDWFYRILTFHGLNMLIFWILFFEVAILYFACTTPLNARLYSKQGRLALVRPDARRRVMTDYIILKGQADVMMTSYLPLLAHPVFYLGIILVAVGTLIGVFNFFATLYVAKRDKAYRAPCPS
jgi:cytochrome c oxidase subunit 1